MIYEIAIAGVIGMILQMLLKARSIQAKAKQANVEFKFWRYFVDDWLSHLISLLSLALVMFIARRRFLDASIEMHEMILGLAATVGYSGADIVSRFFSYTNNRINAAIDFKTTQIDNINNTADKPTPATPPK